MTEGKMDFDFCDMHQSPGGHYQYYSKILRCNVYDKFKFSIGNDRGSLTDIAKIKIHFHITKFGYDRVESAADQSHSDRRKTTSLGSVFLQTLFNIDKGYNKFGLDTY